MINIIIYYYVISLSLSLYSLNFFFFSLVSRFNFFERKNGFKNLDTYIDEKNLKKTPPPPPTTTTHTERSERKRERKKSNV